MVASQTKEKILKDYEKQGEGIIAQMLKILVRAGRKKDDVAYRKIMQKLK